LNFICKVKLKKKKRNTLLKMASNNLKGFDVFISYQWDIKESVTMLYNQLTETHGLRCWMDDFEMGSDLNESKFFMSAKPFKRRFVIDF